MDLDSYPNSQLTYCTDLSLFAPSGLLYSIDCNLKGFIGRATSYSNGEFCSWLISVPGANYIELTFYEFDIELNWDFVTIYDGDSTLSNTLGSYSGTLSSFQVYSSGVCNAVSNIEFAANYVCSLYIR